MSNIPQQDFIDNFLEEASDHLKAIKRNLLVFEETLTSGASGLTSSIGRVNLINELFRSFHTLKGLSGMVGLRPAEELSHRLESVLRGVQNTQITLNQELIDTLLEGAGILEQIVQGVKNSEPEAVNIQPYLEALEELDGQDQRNSSSASPGQVDPSREAASLKKKKPSGTVEDSLDQAFDEYPDLTKNLDSADREIIRAARQEGLALHAFFFSPSAEKSASGVNVNNLREKLQQKGMILKSVPLIKGSQVRFVFLVASPSPIRCEDFPEAECVFLGGGKEEAHAQPASAEEKAPAPPARSAHIQTPAAGSAVRVDLERLDELMRLVSELVVDRSRMIAFLPQVKRTYSSPEERHIYTELEKTVENMGRHLRDIRQAVMRTRMVPIAQVFNHMPLAVRDLARSTGKEIRLEMKGENNEIDKMLVEKLLDPLLHLARNAITHGIETPEERKAAGKPTTGTLTLQASMYGDKLLVEVADDGRGIDTERVRKKAVEDGIIRPEGELSSADLLQVLAIPGFTTMDKATLGAGRGIGMEVVLETLKAVGGQMELETIQGQGTRFFIHLPLTLTILNAIVVRSGEELFAVPQHMVDEVIQIDPTEIVRIESGELIPHRESSLALVRLKDKFKIKQEKQPHVLYGLIGTENKRQAVLVVDKLVGLREIVVRPSSDPFFNQPGVLGATELGDGRVILIIDLPPLLHEANILEE
jgi:two-component system, chemotaxis family, sensor kinase CheA